MQHWKYSLLNKDFLLLREIVNKHAILLSQDNIAEAPWEFMLPTQPFGTAS